QSDDVIDLEQAEKHFRLAARYSASQKKELNANAWYHVARACYLQGVESRNAGVKDNGTGKLREAFEAADKEICTNSPPARYLLAKASALLGEGDKARASLDYAIRADRNYYRKVINDGDFDAIRGEVKNLLSLLTEQRRKKAEEQLCATQDELGH